MTRTCKTLRSAARAAGLAALLLLSQSSFMTTPARAELPPGEQLLPNDLLFNRGGELAVYEKDTGRYKGDLVTRTVSPGAHDSWGFAYGPDGHLYISEYFTANVLRYDGLTGTFLGGFAGPSPGGLLPRIDENGEYQSNGLVALAFGADGNLYAGGGNASGDGLFGFLGPRSSAPGTLSSVFTTGDQVQDVVMGADGSMYLCLYFGSKIVRYYPDTGVVAEFVASGSGGLSGARQITFGPDGNLYVASEYTNSIKRYSGTTGEYIDDFAAAEIIADWGDPYDPNDDLWTVEYGPGGGPLFGPLGLAFGPIDGDLYVSGHMSKILRYAGPTKPNAGEYIGEFVPDSGNGTYLQFDRYHTYAGNNVTVSPIPAATLTFDTVTAPGVTTVTPLDEASAEPGAILPPNLQLSTDSGGFPTYFDIHTTADFGGQPVLLSFAYDPEQFFTGTNPYGPALLHLENGTWVDVTRNLVEQYPSRAAQVDQDGTLDGVDTINKRVYGITTSFSLYAVATRTEYAWSGYLQPINSDGSSVFKSGSTVPVKFALTGTDAGITNLQAKLRYTLVNSDGDAIGEVNEAVSTAAGTTNGLFRYDPASGQYVFNLSTKGMAPGLYRLEADLGDGKQRSVLIGVKGK